ncbi:hypothetical protein [Xanthomonas pisi]|uniref:Uncharacterized protein n=1 Tax=Xanthomonas pisi TaxID=56457 RepID=A0A2S7D6B3_9XANT|nr:hypothetical protein [Xanthomonas pisi]PPU69274.1 hypothetical protein XpiCFBP4643_07105 [Xanthomonas pisi]
MATRDLNDGLFIDPVSVDSVVVDPVIEAGTTIGCAAVLAPAACVVEDAQRDQPPLQLLPAVHCPQAEPRPDWAQARAALLAQPVSQRAAGDARAHCIPHRSRMH